MKYSIFIFFFSVLLLLFVSSWSPYKLSYEITLEYHRLKNDLKVFLFLINTAPLVVVAVYYDIRFCIEPKDRANLTAIFY